MNEPSTDKRHEWHEAVVNRLWERFENRYGTMWIERWAGLPLDRVKREWCDELLPFGVADLANGFNAVKDNRFPPTLPELVEACRAVAKRSGPQQAALSAPILPQDEAKKRIASAAEKVLAGSNGDPRDWARRLRDRHRAGEKLLPIQVQSAAEALGAEWQA